MKTTTFIFCAIVVACFLCTGANCEVDLTKFDHVAGVAVDRIQEQIRSLLSLKNIFSRPLGTSPVEVALKVVMNALEIFTIASGTHFFIPKEELKREMQVSAIACTNLCQNLTTMVEMYQAILNATLFTADELLLTPANADKAPERLFQVMEQFVNASSTLKDVYAQEKADVGQKLRPPAAEGAIDFWYIEPSQALLTMFYAYNYYPRIRYFAANTLFAFWTCESLANTTLKERHELSKDLMAMYSRSENPDEVNKSFAAAIEETAKALNPTKTNLYDTVFKISDILFDNLQDVFGENASD